MKQINGSDPIAVLSKSIINAVKKQIENAKFDRTTVGTVTAIKGNEYTVVAFGGEYVIKSKQSFSLQENVAVTAPQGNFKRLLIRPI